MNLSAVLLAAGQGTRMRSATHKVLHYLAGRTLLDRALDLAAAVGAPRPVVVLGHQADAVRATLPEGVRTVHQEPQLGTGHAVQVAAPLLRQDGAPRLVVFYGDTVLLEPDTLRRVLAQPVGPDVPLALLTAHLPDPTGYGRVLRAADGTVDGLVEEAEATAEQRAIHEAWCGVLVAWTPWLWDRLNLLEPRSKGEYYLPDFVNIARAEGRRVLAVVAGSAEEVQGINDQAQLAEAHRVLWRRSADRLMRQGVTVLDPATTYVEPEVEVEADTVIHPGCHLRGHTRVASGCEIGPDTELSEARVGPDCRVTRSVVEHSTLGARVTVGPFAHIRGGAVIEDDAEVHNCAEVKGSRVGRGTKMHHFSYLGDADVGERVNIGAGAITMNFDGRAKHRTTIGDDAFVGSDTLLRAPVRVGRGATTGGGSVVTHDVPDGEVWAGVPARPLRTSPPPAATPTTEGGLDGS